ENIQGTDIFEANFGFGCWITGNPSIPNDDTGVGGDEWDDMDGWDSQNNIYYVSDDFGTGEVLGFSSAVPTTPFSHHYSNALLNLADDKGVYNALTGPDLTAGGPMTKITAILSWNGYTIQAGTSLTFAMVIAHGADVMSMRQTVWDAQNYYFTETTGVYITEFEDSSSPTQRIEVYNRGQTAVDLSQWEVRNRMGALLTGNWVPDSDLPVGEHRYLDVMSGTLDPEGDIISLYGDTAFLVDSIGYGQFGIAPDPVAGEASSRVWNPGQGRYTNDWTMTISGLSIQTFGAQNTVPSVDSNPLIVLNEVLYYHTPSWERFIELRYIWDGTLDISNFMIVGNGIYTIPGPASVDKNVPAYYFTESADASAAALFASLSTGGDNLYLYNDAGVLLDMVGWTSLHCIDESARRVPEGSGAHNGYDDVSSLAAGWRFCERPGLPLILLEADQKKGTDINTLVSYDLKITNLKNDFDVVDVMLESSVPSGSSADFYSGDGAWTPLTDTDGDGDADIGVLKPNGLAMFESINVTVNITISLNPQNYRENTTIGAQSNTSIYGYDPAFLSTEVSPYINVNKSVNPKSIYTSPDRAQVTVNLTGAGIPQSFSKPQDTVFIIDSSGSMGGSRMPSYPGACISPGNDPGGIRIQAVKQYIDKMSDEDRAAIIGFAADPDHNYLGGAWLTQDVAFFGPVEPHHFRNTETGNKTLIKNDTDTLLFCGGGTNTEMALQFALLELVPGYVPGPLSNPTGRTFPIDNPGDTDGIRYGNDTHWWIIILLTDGDPSHPESATNDEVAFAAANNVRIYTIGLGNVDESYLNQSIAQPTGGEYIYAAKAEDLPQVYERIRTLINNLAGSPIVTPMPQPMVTDIVPPELIVDISSINPAPKSTWTNATGTYIQWDANTILIGESWIATYDVGCILPMSNQNVTKYPFASVDYVSWDDRIIQAPIPSDYITCTAPPSPYITNVEIEPGGVKVTWNGIPGADLYEIYGGPDQTALNLDLADVLDSTSAPQTTWIDANRISTNPDEYYYVVRAIYTDSNPTIRSATSNTGGYYRIQFDAGLNTFSLPL
ncbi:MAG: VWA domain-containing protein, partial [Thermoplasmata archaeon]|nr:VWA domain-containing protein [Thermoplasmata archaeon]